MTASARSIASGSLSSRSPRLRTWFVWSRSRRRASFIRSHVLARASVPQVALFMGESSMQWTGLMSVDVHAVSTGRLCPYASRPARARLRSTVGRGQRERIATPALAFPALGRDASGLAASTSRHPFSMARATRKSVGGHSPSYMTRPASAEEPHRCWPRWREKKASARTAQLSLPWRDPTQRDPLCRMSARHLRCAKPRAPLRSPGRTRYPPR
jgi:hypothetical protein